MNTTEMISIVRLNTLLPDGSVDYPDSVILRELNDTLTTKFERNVVDARAGYWLQRRVSTVTVGNPIVRLPPRACGISKVEIGDTSAAPTYKRLPLVREGHADLFTAPDSSLGPPNRWAARGDRIHLIPTPDSAYSLRLTYYLRPSRLVPAQTAGYITDVNRTTRVVTVSSWPLTYAADGSSYTISVGAGGYFDIVSGRGWHEVQMAEHLGTRTATTQVTFGADADLSSVEPGDYLRGNDTTDWPALPDDFHRCLVDITSMKILIQLDFQSKAGAFAQDANADMQRFNALITDRVQEEATVPRADLTSLRRRW